MAIFLFSHKAPESFPSAYLFSIQIIEASYFILVLCQQTKNAFLTHSGQLPPFSLLSPIFYPKRAFVKKYPPGQNTRCTKKIRFAKGIRIRQIFVFWV